MKVKTKPGLPALVTLGDLDKSITLRQHAELAMEAMNIEIEQECASIRARYAERATELATCIVDESRRQIEYLEAHKSDFDGPPRSRELSAGTVGFRLGQERLVPLSKWTWDKVLQYMLDNGINNFIRRTPEVDREQLLAQKDDFGADGLRSMGLRVVQDDKPFVEIKREDKDAAVAAAEGNAA